MDSKSVRMVYFSPNEFKNLVSLSRTSIVATSLKAQLNTVLKKRKSRIRNPDVQVSSLSFTTSSLSQTNSLLSNNEVTSLQFVSDIFISCWPPLEKYFRKICSAVELMCSRSSVSVILSVAVAFRSSQLIEGSRGWFLAFLHKFCKLWTSCKKHPDSSEYSSFRKLINFIHKCPSSSIFPNQFSNSKYFVLVKSCRNVLIVSRSDISPSH
mmetsp:Transcript_26443/g.39253  ORF Transcript_26443/g.39253 Transcript_26443/m.39253 type:complete len:210 (+) Transcript_26443:1395-2024(+)